MSTDDPFYAPTHTVAPIVPTPRRVLGRLWSLAKGDRTLICVLVEAPVGEELRVLEHQEIVRTELLADRAAAISRSDTMRLQLEARGWLRT